MCSVRVDVRDCGRQKDVMFCFSANEGIEELVVEGLVPGPACEYYSEGRAVLAHDRLEAVHGGALGGIAMCLDAAENPMMYVPWWVNIGWFHATRSSSSG